ncbi:syntaxin 2/SSOI/SNARE domain containing protein [Blumeria hordei DH14]|uniref:Syntaxin 2/SSOI/SNARE domain containing protein n=1 Tax=Blumeria graminis f. sp. hordei (strain DH14) TaxID=546991 RepID=N1JEW7_BLUG1|nr:syntaxin 2/SSOI/SNARE domain containing protein [Blumeria hordei DH14]
MVYNQQSQNGSNPYGNLSDAEAGISRNVGHERRDGRPGNSMNQGSVNSPPYQQNQAHTPTVLAQQDFLARVDFIKSEIRSLSANVQEIAALHQRALTSPESSSSSPLENLVVQTQLKNTQIRDQIKQIEADAIKTQDGSKSLKARQAKQLKGEFEKSLNDYRQEELAYRQRYRDQIARQYRIVNPEASDAEVEEASKLDWGSEGVFQTALKSNRFGQVSSVLGDVRARHNELQRIESTLTDLANLFADMAQIVEAQDPVIENTEQNAIHANEHIDKANTQIDAAKNSAARARKLKWYCLLVVILIIVAIALGVGLGIGLTKSTNKAASTATNQN